jgi:hypothetical protein
LFCAALKFFLFAFLFAPKNEKTCSELLHLPPRPLRIEANYLNFDLEDVCGESPFCVVPFSLMRNRLEWPKIPQWRSAQRSLSAPGKT